MEGTDVSRISNPIIAGFAPDPSIIRVDHDYYIATSTMEWLPGIRIYHSQDLANWEIVGHALEGENTPELKGVAASNGVWAPDLSYDPATSTFYVVYSILTNQIGEMFDLENFVSTAKDPRGPWSRPIYLNSVGFDPSLFHDDDGKKWLVTLEWDTRDGYEHPGAILLEEYDPIASRLIGPSSRISRGTTERGCLEGPHIYKRGDYYYLMTAEGGTGYGHGVALGRSASIGGPFEPSPVNPILTSSPTPFVARGERDYLRTERFNPDSGIQKAGHGSLVSTADGGWYIAHLSARPDDHLMSMLGRETSIQAVEWTDDGWLRLVDGGNLARPSTPSLNKGAGSQHLLPLNESFESKEIDPRIYSLRRPITDDWAVLGPRPGHLRLRGGASLFSRFDVSLIAAPLQSVNADVETVIDFEPHHFSQSAGLVIYYNNLQFYYLRVCWSEALNGRALGIMIGDQGSKSEDMSARVKLQEGPVKLSANLSSGNLQFSWSQGKAPAATIGLSLDASKLSDEYTRGFTGTLVGLTCQDAFRRQIYARFDHLRLTYR
jgi:xylan 1,4-beta-xylosidase